MAKSNEANKKIRCNELKKEFTNNYVIAIKLPYIIMMYQIVEMFTMMIYTVFFCCYLVSNMVGMQNWK
jgi:hypothetical protein